MGERKGEQKDGNRVSATQFGYSVRLLGLATQYDEDDSTIAYIGVYTRFMTPSSPHLSNKIGHAPFPVVVEVVGHEVHVPALVRYQLH